MNARGQGIIQNFRWLMGANVVVKPLWFLFVLLSTRLLGPEEFGRFMFAMAYTVIIAFALEGGIDVLTMRELATDGSRVRTMLGQTLILKLLSAVGLTAVAVGSAVALGLPAETVHLIALAVLPALFNALMTHARYVFRAFEVLRFEARSILVEKVAIVLLGAAALLVARSAVALMAAFALAYAIAAPLTLMMLFRHFGRPVWQPRARAMLQTVIRPALPFALMTVLQVVYLRAGTMMLQWLTGSDTTVGYYNAGYRLVDAFALFPTGVIMPMYASFARGRNDKTKVMQLLPGAARLLLAISTMVALPMLVFHEELVRLIFGPAFVPASAAIGVVILTMVPLGLNWLMTNLAGAVDRQRRLNVFFAVMTGLNLILYWLLIPAFGLAGAAWTTVLTEIAMAASGMWVVRDYLDRKAFTMALGGIALPAGAAWGCAWLGLLPGPFLAQLSLFLAVLVAGFFLTGIARVEEIRRILQR